MKLLLDSLVYRKLTANDFDKINSVVTSAYGGGGQGYIDFPVKEVSIPDWTNFLGAPTGRGAKGPSWSFPIHSAGVAPDPVPDLKIYQRRSASVCVAAQKLSSRESNRVPAWRPINGFPSTFTDGITVYFVKTTDGEIWAGWFFLDSSMKSTLASTPLERILDDSFSAGNIVFRDSVIFDTSNPFDFDFSKYIPHASEDDVEEEILGEDVSESYLSDIASVSTETKERLVRYKTRNRKLVKELKKLYNGTCQISGETFVMKNGENYSEVHHLIPIGKNGSDSFANAIVVSPRIHRMLHYANVGPIDLSMIVNHKLDIEINGSIYTITWKPNHEDKVKEALSL